jgi:hypothetical protein
MPIRYKVVKKRTRVSAIINGRSRYALKYLAMTKVFARPETLGIMVFKTRCEAEEWAYQIEYQYYNTLYADELIVLKVDTIGKGKTPKDISMAYSTPELCRFYEYQENDSQYFDVTFTSPPLDTICYPGVLVLE